jgi:hypothetical protein
MSNLPIRWGNKVAFFVLAPTSNQRLMETCYPEDNFVPLCFPIIGEYDDYGRIEKFTMNPYMEQYLKTFTKLYTSHYASGGDKEIVDYQYTSAEDFIQELCSHNLFVGAAMSKNKLPLEFVIMHYERYQLLLEDMGNRIPYDKNENLRTLHRNRVIETLKNIDKKRNDFNMPQVTQTLGDMWAKQQFNFCDEYHFSHEYRWRSLNAMADQYLDIQDETIIDDMVNYLLWYQVMMYSRKGYHCYSGGGSQSEEYKIHKIIADFILKKCEERRNDEDEGYQPESVLSETIFFW